jgi:hypothetical protein
VLVQHNQHYIEETAVRAKAVKDIIGVNVELYAFDREGLVKGSMDNVRFYNTHSEALAEAVKKVLELIKT